MYQSNSCAKSSALIFRVQILSVNGSKNLNKRKSQQVLRYAARPTRTEGTPRLNGVYKFGTRPHFSIEEASTSSSRRITDSPGAQLSASLNRRSREAFQSSLNAEVSPWYRNSGKFFQERWNISYPEEIQERPVKLSCSMMRYYVVGISTTPRALMLQKSTQGRRV